MSSSESSFLGVPSPRKTSEAESVDSGYHGPSRETSASLLRKSSDLPTIEEMKESSGILTQRLSSLHNIMSSSLASIAEGETIVRSETPTELQFINVPDYQRVVLSEASQPSIMHFNESHFPISLTLSSSGSQSQKSILHITVTSSGESQSQPENCNKPFAKSDYSTVLIAESGHSASLSAEQESILKRTVVNKTHLFTKHTNFVTLVPHLFEKKLLHTVECEHLEKLPSHQEQANHFYTVILPRKGKRAYRWLYKCLKRETQHLGHKDLVEVLERALRGEHSPQSSSDSSPTTENNSETEQGTLHRLGDYSNPPSALQLKADVDRSSFDDTLCDDKKLSFKGDDGCHNHIIHPRPCTCTHSHLVDISDEGKSDPNCSKEALPSSQSSHKAANRNGRTNGSCCTIL